ncbi:MAG: inorganic diphosphatase [Saprospiraceae bacterium]|nr:inorganic diphosphatase [Saprospiraceae bacterium]
MNKHTAHPWHGINHGWDKKTLQGIIEIPQGSRIKYEIDKTSGLIKMDRLLSSSFEYPINYGFIPKTLGEDGDPLDILVLTHSPLVPLCLVKARVLGIMHMIDKGISDHKILSVADSDVSLRHINNLEQLPEHFFNELKNFFEEYTKLENKQVIIPGFSDTTEANTIIAEHIERYEEKNWIFYN